MDLQKVRQAMAVINQAQQAVWNLHHAFKQYDEPKAIELWKQSLQIEHALLVLNEEVLGGRGYFETTN